MANKTINLFKRWDPARVCIQSTNQHNEFVCLGTVEDAVGSDSFPEVFVNVVICTAVDKKTIHMRVGLVIHLAAVGHCNNTAHWDDLWSENLLKEMGLDM